MTTYHLPTDSAARKNIPIVRGCFDYFPAALAAVASLSKSSNDKHNPGEEMHHARGKSMDHADCIVRHLMDRGTVDPEDNVRHSVKMAWRALALLQEELEREEGAPLPRGASPAVPGGPPWLPPTHRTVDHRASSRPHAGAPIDLPRTAPNPPGKPRMTEAQIGRFAQRFVGVDRSSDSGACQADW